ncbi:hypothetical protein HHX47_DHR2000434 [Lentinula edodes]|nr:hypothetical protein HHX47_DHR2000434 [Lentinula edodes]
MSSITSFFSSFLPTIQAEAPAEEKPADVVKESEEEGKEEEKEEEEEEEEPEDPHPAIRDECQNSAKCAPLLKHFEHCQEKVQAGEGFKGEDCVEEMYVCVCFCVVLVDDEPQPRS